MRVNRDQWIDAALSTLIQEGHTALSAERLARKLGVTRGSFYHHFPSMDDFVAAVLQRWEEVHTTQVLQQARADEPHQELLALIEQSFSMSLDLEIAIRAWAGAHPEVAKFAAGIQEKRMRKLIELYQRIAGEEKKGEKLAKIAFYGFLGAAHALPRLGKEDLRKLIMDVHELMMTLV